MGYQIPVFRELLKNIDEIHVIHWDEQKKTSYSPPHVNGVIYYKRSALKTNDIKQLIDFVRPELIYVSGWMDYGYLRAVYYARKNNYKVVTMFDDVWYSTLKQRIARIFFPFIRSYFYSHAWVSGYYQYDFARKLGFPKDKIIVSSLTCDVDLFSEVYSERVLNDNWIASKKFLYVGRFAPEKGLDGLLNVWKDLVREGLSNGWSMTFIGSGPINFTSSQSDYFQVKPFLMPDSLVRELKDYAVFILPSLKEPWGVVVHEFTSAGFPIISSNNCGSAQHFVIDGYNGFTFQPWKEEELKSCILKIINLDPLDLKRMSDRSHALSKSISPSISAAKLCTIMDNRVYEKSFAN
jgi:glycosyltransferase involved in cell wall biosynthesis